MKKTEIIIGKVKAVSIKNLENGKIGFLTDQSEKWLNLENTNDEILKIIKKGNTIKFENRDGKLSNFSIEKEAKQTEKSFDDLISFEELLNSAHKKGLTKINTEMVSIDWEVKTALFKAVVQMGEKIYTGYGDATQENCGQLVSKHWIRMAETRAIARALRWATNNASTSKEETENGN